MALAEEIRAHDLINSYMINYLELNRRHDE